MGIGPIYIPYGAMWEVLPEAYMLASGKSPIPTGQSVFPIGSPVLHDWVTQSGQWRKNNKCEEDINQTNVFKRKMIEKTEGVQKQVFYLEQKRNKVWSFLRRTFSIGRRGKFPSHFCSRSSKNKKNTNYESKTMKVILFNVFDKSVLSPTAAKFPAFFALNSSKTHKKVRNMIQTR